MEDKGPSHTAQDDGRPDGLQAVRRIRLTMTVGGLTVPPRGRCVLWLASFVKIMGMAMARWRASVLHSSPVAYLSAGKGRSGSRYKRTLISSVCAPLRPYMAPTIRSNLVAKRI